MTYNPNLKWLTPFFTVIAILTAPLYSTEGTETLKVTSSSFPWKKEIVTTVFWIGQGCTSISDTTNAQSAWDAEWTQNYGGSDDPTKRSGFLPKKFAATLNPFYVALPFNDVKYPDLAKKFIPWYKNPSEKNRWISQCKGKWIQIRNKNGKVAYGQWQDVGPIRTDNAKYVFGLDVSPAIQDFLGLNGLDKTDWRFVEDFEVPPGPWLTYGEQAVLFSVIKKEELELAKDFEAPRKSIERKKKDS
ncbi:MAG: hypothetical protein V4507_07245 [Verrucomicrobiota bacterium]